MPNFIIHFEVASSMVIVIEAEDAEEAVEKFDDMDMAYLIANGNELDSDLKFKGIAEVKDED